MQKQGGTDDYTLAAGTTRCIHISHNKMSTKFWNTKNYLKPDVQIVKKSPDIELSGNEYTIQHSQ
jgi:hypothetical protein